MEPSLQIQHQGRRGQGMSHGLQGATLRPDTPAHPAPRLRLPTSSCLTDKPWILGYDPRSQRRKWPLTERPERERDCYNNSNVTTPRAQQARAPLRSTRTPCARAGAIAASGLGLPACSPWVFSGRLVALKNTPAPVTCSSLPRVVQWRLKVTH